MSRRNLTTALNLLVACLWLAFVGYLVVRGDRFGWDFRVYLQAARDFFAHRSPYESPYPVHIGLRTAYLPFIYPPLTLIPIGIFAFLPESVAWLVWLALKLLAFGYLLKVWRRSFFRFPLDWRFGLFALFAFNASLYTDLATGNLAVFEALTLTLGIEAAMKGRDLKSAAWIFLAAAFKLIPILFLGYLAWRGGPKRARVVLYTCLALLVYLSLNLALFPKETVAFFYAALGRSDDRSNNPSSYEFFLDLSSRAPFLDARLMYLLFAGAVIVASWRAWKKDRPDPATEALFAWLVLALLLPRMMIYSYVQLLPVAWIALRPLKGLALYAAIAAIGVVLPTSYLLAARPSIGATLDHAIGVQPGVWGYASFFAAFMIWAIFVMRVLPRNVHFSQTVATD